MTRAMRVVPVRFGSEQIELIKQEAEYDGLSVSQFIRDAATARAVMAAAKRGNATLRLWERLIIVAEEIGNDALAAELRAVLDETIHI